MSEEINEIAYSKLLDEHIELIDRVEKAKSYIKKSINNPQPFYEYIYGDENGRVVNLDKLLEILGKGE